MENSNKELRQHIDDLQKEIGLLEGQMREGSSILEEGHKKEKERLEKEFLERLSNLTKENETLKQTTQNYLQRITQLESVKGDGDEEIHSKFKQVQNQRDEMEKNLKEITNICNETKIQRDQLMTRQAKLEAFVDKLLANDLSVTDDNDDLIGKIKSLYLGKKEAQEEFTRLDAEYRTSRNEVSNLNNQSNDLAIQIKNLQTKLMTIEESKSSLKDELHSARESKSLSSEETNHLKESNALLSEEIHQLKLSKSSLTDEVGQLKQANSSLLEEVASLKQSNSSTLEELNQVKQSKSLLTDEVDPLKQLNSSLTEEVDQLKQSNSSLSEEIGQLKQSNSSLTEKVSDLGKSNPVLTEEIVKLKENKNTLESSITSMQHEIKEKSVKTKIIEDILNELKSIIVDIPLLPENSDVKSALEFLVNEREQLKKKLLEEIANSEETKSQLGDLNKSLATIKEEKSNLQQLLDAQNAK